MAVDPDIELIKRAKRGDFTAQNELLAKYKPLLVRKSSTYRNAPVPEAAVHGEAMKLLLQTIDKFDPKQDILFKTFLETQLRGLYRYVNSNKNVARVPEHRILQIRRYQHAKSLLQAQKDREPTSDEMADHLGWSMQQVEMMDTALSRGAFSAAESAERGFADPTTYYNRLDETFEFMYFQMMPEEKLVYDYSVGAHGKPKLESVVDIAKKTGLTPDKIYAIKRKLAQSVLRSV